VPSRHLLPASLLDIGGLGKRASEPVPRRRRKEIQRRPHAYKSDQFRIYKQVFVNRYDAYDLRGTLIDTQLFMDVMATFPTGPL